MVARLDSSTVPGTKIAPMAASLAPVASLTWQCQGPPPPRAWVKARQLRRAITADALAETQEITGCVALHHRPKRSLSLHVLAHASIRTISKTGRGAAMFVLCSPPADAEDTCRSGAERGVIINRVCRSCFWELDLTAGVRGALETKRVQFSV